jgi:hypothetical protein
MAWLPVTKVPFRADARRDVVESALWREPVHTRHPDAVKLDQQFCRNTCVATTAKMVDSDSVSVCGSERRDASRAAVGTAEPGSGGRNRSAGLPSQLVDSTIYIQWFSLRVAFLLFCAL